MNRMPDVDRRVTRLIVHHSYHSVCLSSPNHPAHLVSLTSRSSGSFLSQSGMDGGDVRNRRADEVTKGEGKKVNGDGTRKEATRVRNERRS